MDHYADNSVALTVATRKTAPTTVEWTQQMEDEFRYIKDSLCCVPFLIIPTEDDTFVLQTDTSGTGIGAMLSVKRDWGEVCGLLFQKAATLGAKVLCYRAGGTGGGGCHYPLRDLPDQQPFHC